jgi:hypothetical protein
MGEVRCYRDNLVALMLKARLIALRYCFDVDADIHCVSLTYGALQSRFEPFRLR